MDNRVWEDLEKYFLDDRRDYFCENVPDSEIESAQSDMGLKFCESYKKFLSTYGGAMISGDLVHGLRYQDDMSSNCWSVVDVTNFYKTKQKWPGIDDWYIISDDGRGNPIGINPKGEVYLSDHDSGFEQVKLADSFEEFLHKLLTDTLYE